MLPLLLCLAPLGCTGQSAATLPARESRSSTEHAGDSPGGSTERTPLVSGIDERSEAAVQDPIPLTSTELAELEYVAVSALTFGIEFSHCHDRVDLSRWGGKVKAREHIPTEEELLELEALEYDEPLLTPRLAEGYVKLVYSTWRDLLTEHFRKSNRNPTAVRKLLARQRRIAPRMLAALRRVSSPNRDGWRTYRYELALHYLMLQDFTAAREAAKPLLNSKWQPYGKQATLLTALSHLEQPVETTDLQRARSLLMRIPATNDYSSHAVVARCFLAEVHARLGHRSRALAELRNLRDGQDRFGIWRVAQQRLEELEQQE